MTQFLQAKRSSWRPANKALKATTENHTHFSSAMDAASFMSYDATFLISINKQQYTNKTCKYKLEFDWDCSRFLSHWPHCCTLPSRGGKTDVQAVDLATQLAKIQDTVCTPVNSAKKLSTMHNILHVQLINSHKHEQWVIYCNSLTLTYPTYIWCPRQRWAIQISPRSLATKIVVSKLSHM